MFRQVHRVLKLGAPLVFSLPHPAYDMIDDDSDQPLLVRRSYFDRTPIDYEWNGIAFTDYHHTIADLYMSLVRASYRVDTVLEPEPVARRHVASTGVRRDEHDDGREEHHPDPVDVPEDDRLAGPAEGVEHRLCHDEAAEHEEVDEAAQRARPRPAVQRWCPLR